MFLILAARARRAAEALPARQGSATRELAEQLARGRLRPSRHRLIDGGVGAAACRSATAASRRHQARHAFVAVLAAAWPQASPHGRFLPPLGVRAAHRTVPPCRTDPPSPSAAACAPAVRQPGLRAFGASGRAAAWAPPAGRMVAEAGASCCFVASVNKPQDAVRGTSVASAAVAAVQGTLDSR